MKLEKLIKLVKLYYGNAKKNAIGNLNKANILRK